MYKPTKMLVQTLDCGIKLKAYYLYLYADYTLAIVSKASKSWKIPKEKMYINKLPVKLALI